MGHWRFSPALTAGGTAIEWCRRLARRFNVESRRNQVTGPISEVCVQRFRAHGCAKPHGRRDLKGKMISTADSPGRMSGLFPSISVSQSGYLAVDDLHEIYWETCGNPEGTPVVFLHGGPGAGAAPDHRRFFDPASYRIVVFDQRGAGRSRPQGELKDNSTPHLIADLEALRQVLRVGWFSAVPGAVPWLWLMRRPTRSRSAA